MDESRKLGLGKKFVLVDHRRDGHFGRRIATFDTHHAALAAHADAFGERNFGGKGEREVNRRTSLDSRIDEEADAASADVASLGRVLVRGFAIADTDGQAQREPASGAFVFRSSIRSPEASAFFRLSKTVGKRLQAWQLAALLSSGVEARFQSFKVSEKYPGFDGFHLCFFIETLKL